MKSALASLLLTLLVAVPRLAQAQALEGSGVDLNQANERAADLVSRQAYDEAIAIYRQIVAVDPFWADIWYNLGEVSRVAEQPGPCVLYFTRYLYLIPDAGDEAMVQRHIGTCARDIDHSARLTITAAPEQARIAIDRVEIASGHLAAFPLLPGPHEIEVSAAEHHPVQLAVVLAADETRDLPIALEPLPLFGTLRVEVNVEGAEVTIEDEPVGMTPLDTPIRLPVGQYLVRFRKEGYHDWVRRVPIEADREYLLDVEMRGL